MPTCSVEGCERPHRANGYCVAHLMRVRRTGSPGTAPIGKPRTKRKVCSVELCGRWAYGHGLCRGHWERARRNVALAGRIRKWRRRLCVIAGCGRKHYGLGFCVVH